MSTSVTLTITKHDNGTVGAHLSGVLNGSQETMEATIPNELHSSLSQALVAIWLMIRQGQEATTRIMRN